VIRTLAACDANKSKRRMRVASVPGQETLDAAQD
jgi:hypothetical protein